MKTNVHHLVGWKLFCAKCREGEDRFCPAATRRQLNRFYARYRLAAHFEAVHAYGYSENALRGYTAGLRLLAAYSAAELLGEARSAEERQMAETVALQTHGIKGVKNLMTLRR